MQDISAALQELAVNNGYNQADLARLLRVSQPTISRLLRHSNARRGPAYRRIIARLEELRISKNEYFDIQEESEIFKRHFLRLRPSSQAEADAISKLLTALEHYVAVKVGQSR